MPRIYQQRGKGEVSPQSLQSKGRFAKSPTKTIRTHNNPFFACWWADVQVERLRLATKRNPFAMKAKIYQKARARAFEQLQVIKTIGASA